MTFQAEDKMNRMLDKVAVALAFLLGALAILAGGRALLGSLPGWNVISWLPVFNFVAGVLTVLAVVPLIWRSSRYAAPAAFVLLAANALVLLVLQLAFRTEVAMESMAAMILRIAVWGVILLLLFWQRRKKQSGPA
jgi:FtsH-binding integral membrane protein